MTTTLEALKSPFNSVTISFLAARSTCSLRLTACYLGEPNLGEPEGNKPPVCDLPPALSMKQRAERRSSCPAPSGGSSRRRSRGPNRSGVTPVKDLHPSVQALEPKN